MATPQVHDLGQSESVKQTLVHCHEVVLHKPLWQSPFPVHGVTRISPSHSKPVELAHTATTSVVLEYDAGSWGRKIRADLAVPTVGGAPAWAPTGLARSRVLIGDAEPALTVVGLGADCAGKPRAPRPTVRGVVDRPNAAGAHGEVAEHAAGLAAAGGRRGGGAARVRAHASVEPVPIGSAHASSGTRRPRRRGRRPPCSPRRSDLPMLDLRNSFRRCQFPSTRRTPGSRPNRNKPACKTTPGRTPTGGGLLELLWSNSPLAQSVLVGARRTHRPSRASIGRNGACVHRGVRRASWPARGVRAAPPPSPDDTQASVPGSHVRPAEQGLDAEQALDGDTHCPGNRRADSIARARPRPGLTRVGGHRVRNEGLATSGQGDRSAQCQDERESSARGFPRAAQGKRGHQKDPFKSKAPPFA